MLTPIEARKIADKIRSSSIVLSSESDSLARRIAGSIDDLVDLGVYNSLTSFVGAAKILSERVIEFIDSEYL
jgi:hypothetical protein